MDGLSSPCYRWFFVPIILDMASDSFRGSITSRRRHAAAATTMAFSQNLLGENFPASPVHRQLAFQATHGKRQDLRQRYSTGNAPAPSGSIQRNPLINKETCNGTQL